MSDLVFLLDFPKDCPATAAKITVSTIQNGKTSKKLWNYAINKPCQHFVLGPIIMDSFNLTSNCKINKGSYAIHLNYIEKVKLFLGSKFFYGTYEFRIFSFNKNDNFFCVDTIIDIKNSN
ncbi:uncharacterized protein LOC134198783 [Bombyx mori]|uniref:uncharacterized protein LOC134198783 n=1 Tax=Bombyx mori TaxID=7091 RepID=UPI00034FBB62